ncbi:MAG: DMT family transporter [Candidatus Woesearchaeota archaeon]
MIALIGIMLALTCLVLWGVSDLITKISLDHESKWKVLFISQLSGGLLVLTLAFFFADLKQLFSIAVIYLFVLGFMNLCGTYTFYKAIKIKGIALTTPIMNSWVLVSIILGLIFYNESMSIFQGVAVLLIIGGIYLITTNSDKLVFDKSFVYPILSILIFGIFYFSLKVPNLIFGAVIVTSMIKILTSLFSIPILIKKRIKITFIKQKILFYVILIGFLDALGFLAFNSSLKLAPVSLIAPIVSAAPALSVVLGILFLKEHISKRQASGIIITIIGLIIIAI